MRLSTRLMGSGPMMLTVDHSQWGGGSKLLSFLASVSKEVIVVSLWLLVTTEYNVAGIAFSNILSPMWPPDKPNKDY